MIEKQLFAKLYLDEDVHKRLAQALRLRGYDVVSAHEIGYTGLTDSEQLAYAVSQSRVIVTFNVEDFVKLNIEYQNAGKEHFGIIVSKQRRIGEMVRRLSEFLNQWTSDELENNIWWL